MKIMAYLLRKYNFDVLSSEIQRMTEQTRGKWAMLALHTVQIDDFRNFVAKNPKLQLLTKLKSVLMECRMDLILGGANLKDGKQQHISSHRNVIDFHFFFI